MKLFWILLCFCVNIVISDDSHSYSRRWDNLETFNRYQPEARRSYNALRNDEGLTYLNYLAKLIGVPPFLLKSLIEGKVESFLVEARNHNVSSKCINDTETTIKGLFAGKTWALQIVDSTGKPPSGLLELDLTWLGNYDECRNITVPKSHGFNTQYCSTSIGIKQPETSEINISGYLSFKLNWGVCVPQSCTVDDITGYIDVVLDLLPKTNVTKLLRVEKTYCKAESLELTPHAIACIALLSVLGTIMLVATFYDVIMRYTVSRRARQNQSPILPSSKKNIQDQSASASMNSSAAMGRDDVPLVDESTVEKVVQKELNALGTLKKLLLAFSVYTNAAKILTVSNNTEGQLTAVHGIRFISMTWVILGHTFFFMSAYVANIIPYYILTHIKRWTFLAIINATFSVDSFFVMSGCLLAYLTLREFAKKGGPGKINWVMFYVHRYWRLTSTYALILFTYVSLFRYFADGPMYPDGEYGPEPYCKTSWWTNFLYINNIVKSKEMCMGWSWYLANDMQFFIISPIILIGFYAHWAIGGGISLVLILTTFISSGIINTQSHGGVTIFTQADAFDKIYIKPYTRIGPYIVGVVLGYILFKTNRKIKMHWSFNLLGWLVAAVCCAAPLYGISGAYNGENPPLEVASLYQALGRHSWAIGVAWVIFACTIGNGGWINTFLSWPALVPLSRLTYCAYLVHPIVMDCVYGSVRKTLYMTDIYMIYYFFGNLVASYLVAFAASLAFEAPLIGIERILLRPAPKQELKSKQ